MTKFCETVSDKSWLDVLNRIESRGWRRQVMEFVEEQPNVPAPEIIEGVFAPLLEWGAGLRLSRDYLDFEVYEIHTHDWVRVTEEEFLNWLRIQYSL